MLVPVEGINIRHLRIQSFSRHQLEPTALQEMSLKRQKRRKRHTWGVSMERKKTVKCVQIQKIDTEDVCEAKVENKSTVVIIEKIKHGNF